MTTELDLVMTSPAAVYARRRARLAAELRRPLAVCAGVAPARNYATNPHRFRAGSSYLYLGGPPLEGAAWLIEPGSDGDHGCTLLRPVLSPDDLVWGGAWPGDEVIAAAVGLDPRRLESLDRLGTLVAAKPAGFLAPPCLTTHRWLEQAGLSTAREDELLAMIGLRLVKDDHELAAMRRAAAVTMEAHRAAMAATVPGRREAEVAAAFRAVLAAHEYRESFNSIVTIRGDVLHNVGYPHRLQAGRLMLVDAGAEEPGGYACDVTRTYPVTGKWSAVQRHLYETVLQANRETTAACLTGRRFRDVHDLAARIICEGLVEAELLCGEPADLAGRYAHTLFFCHGLGHLIGLDVHDMEDFGDLAGYAPGRTRRPEFGNSFLRLDRDLEPGMCLTIEPGIYLVPAIWDRDELVRPFADVVNRPAVDALLAEQFGGVRIEDTICIRDGSEPEVLTADLAKEPDSVSPLVGVGG